MGQLSQTTQQNASSSEELAATAEEMSNQAQQLQELMSMFKAENGLSRHATARKSSIVSMEVKKAGSARPRPRATLTHTDAPDEAHFTRF